MVRLATLLLGFALLLAASCAPAVAQERRESEPLVVLEALEIEPAQPGPDTLCHLRVRIRNNGPDAAASFVFGVRINGQELGIYKSHVYMQTIAAGTVGELQLFSFWTTESSRAIPEDGQLRVDVALREARWVRINRSEDVTEYTLLESVEGLPVSVNEVVPLGTASRR